MPQGDDTELTRTPGSPGPSPGTPDSPEPSPGTPDHAHTWGAFRLIGELGRGGFGRVYHAWDPTLTRDIALKVVRLPDATRAAAALHEGRMLARVRHRNVVTVYGAQQIGDEVGVWMELIRGRHLSQLVHQHGPLGAEEATVIGISVCQALAAVHGASLLHRDIKANNVMRESGGRIVLMDFGAGRESGPAAAGDLAGTPLYMAPEVLDGRPASPASDLYSVGVLLYYVVTGEYPVAGHSLLELSLAHRRGQRRLLADRRPDLPDGFVSAVERALASQASDRPSSAGAMLRDLTNALPGSIAWEARSGTSFRLDPTTPGATPPAPLLTTPQTVAPWSLVTLWTGAIAATVAVIGLLGLVTTAAFNQVLGREAVFSNDGPFDWWVYGAKSLVWPAVLAAFIVLGGRLVVTVSKAVARMFPPFRRTGRRLRDSVARTAPHLGVESVVTISQWLVFLQVVSLGLIGIWFRGLLAAVTYPSLVDRDLLALLAPDHAAPLFYRSVLAVVLVATVSAWYALLVRPGARAAIHRTTLVAGAAATMWTLLMLAMPYRILYHNDMVRVSLDGQRCYEVGVRAPQVLLYCPDLQPPRVKIADSATLTRPSSTVLESIFSQASPPP